MQGELTDSSSNSLSSFLLFCSLWYGRKRSNKLPYVKSSLSFGRLHCVRYIEAWRIGIWWLSTFWNKRIRKQKKTWWTRRAGNYILVGRSLTVLLRNLVGCFVSSYTLSLFLIVCSYSLRVLSLLLFNCVWMSIEFYLAYCSHSEVSQVIALTNSLLDLTNRIQTYIPPCLFFLWDITSEYKWWYSFPPCCKCRLQYTFRT